jgi:hypothetical protein
MKDYTPAQGQKWQKYIGKKKKKNYLKISKKSISPEPAHQLNPLHGMESNVFTGTSRSTA